MSFDLVLYRPKGLRALTDEEVDAVMRHFPQAQRFSIGCPAPNYPYPEFKDGFQFTTEDGNVYGLDSSGPVLAFNISYGSSPEFGEAAVGTVRKVAQRLGLKIFDPQAEANGKDDLLESWLASYVWACQAMQHAARPKQDGPEE